MMVAERVGLIDREHWHLGEMWRAGKAMGVK